MINTLLQSFNDSVPFITWVTFCNDWAEALWSSGLGRRLESEGCVFESWRPILDEHFFTFICCKNCNVCLKKTKINEKEAGVGPFLKKNIKHMFSIKFCWWLHLYLGPMERRRPLCQLSHNHCPEAYVTGKDIGKTIVIKML